MRHLPSGKDAHRRSSRAGASQTGAPADPLWGGGRWCEPPRRSMRSARGGRPLVVGYGVCSRGVRRVAGTPASGPAEWLLPPTRKRSAGLAAIASEPASVRTIRTGVVLDTSSATVAARERAVGAPPATSASLVTTEYYERLTWDVHDPPSQTRHDLDIATAAGAERLNDRRSGLPPPGGREWERLDHQPAEATSATIAARHCRGRRAPVVHARRAALRTWAYMALRCRHQPSRSRISPLPTATGFQVIRISTRELLQDYVCSEAEAKRRRYEHAGE